MVMGSAVLLAPRSDRNSTSRTVQIALQTGPAKGGEKLGVSQEEFADLCGLDRTLHWPSIELGERKVVGLE